MRFKNLMALFLVCFIVNFNIDLDKCSRTNIINSLFNTTMVKINGAWGQNREDIITEQRADSLIYLGNSAKDEGSWDQALTWYNQALGLYHNCDNPRKTANCLLSIGMAYYNLNDYSQAIFYYNNALDIIKNQLSSEPLLEAECKLRLGWAYFYLEDYKQATWTFEEARKLYQQLKKTNFEANCLWGKALCSFDSEDYQKALSEFDQAGNLYKVLGDNLQRAKCLYYQGYCYFISDKYQQADSLQKIASLMFQKEGDTKWQAKSLQNSGMALYYLEKYEKATEQYQEAAKLFHIINDTTGAANSIAGLGDSYFKLKNYDYSASWYDQAIALFKQLRNDSKLALCFLMQGHCYYNLGRYADAESPYLEASEIFQKLDKAHQQAKSYHGLADCYRKQEQLRQALEFYSSAIKLYQIVPDDGNVAECSEQMGNCYYNLTEYEQAGNFYLKAANYYHALADTSSEANSIQNLAECYFQRKLYREACSQYDLAANLYHSLKDWLSEARCQFNSGQGFYNLPDYPAALEKYREASACYSLVPDQDGKIKSLLSIGEIYLKMNLAPEALEIFQQTVQLCEKVNNLAGLADGYFNMAGVYKRRISKQPEQAISNNRMAEECYLKALGYYRTQADSQGIADSHSELGGLYFDKSEYESAQQYYQLALEIYTRLHQAKNAANCYFNLGTVQFNLKQYAQALELFNKSLKLYQDQNDTEGIADCYSLLGHTYLNLEPPQSTRARQNFQQALSLYRMLPEPDFSGEAFCYKGMGNVYAYEGQYAEAKTQYLKVVELYDRIADLKNKAYCKILLGNTEVDLINFNDALSWYTDALHSFDEIKNYQEMVYVMTKIGKLYYYQDQYEDALVTYEKALTLAIDHEVKTSQLICYIDIGNVYNEVNLPDSALVYYQQGLKLAQQLDDKTDIGTCLMNIGTIYYDRDDLLKAQENFENALMIARTQPESHFLVICLINYGNLFCKRELIEKGVINYQEALQLSDRLKDIGGKALSLNNLGIVDVEQGKYSEALIKFKQAEKILLENYLRRILVTIYANQAIVYEKNEQYPLAFEAYKAAIDIVQDIRAGLKREHMLRSFIESKADLYDRMITLLLQKMNNIETAALYLEHSKYLDLQEAYRRIAIASGDKKLVELWDKYEKISQQIRKYEEELEQSRKKLPKERDLEKEQRLSRLLTWSKKDADSLAQQLGPGVQIRVGQLQKLQPKIPKDAIFILYHPSQHNLFAFLISRDAIQVREVAVSRNELHEKIRQYRETIHQDLKSSRDRGSLPIIDTWKGKNVQSLAAISQELYQYLIEPIEKYLIGKQLLTFIPSGQLYYLPLHALAHKKSDGTLEFLIERWRVNYLSSLSFLTIAEARSTYRSGNYPRQIVALANADNTLLAAENEAQQVRVFAPDAEIYLNTKATEEVAVAKSRTCSVLILSTHCMLNNQNPFRTFIKLAPSSGYDGRWHVGEVQEITCPNLDLVILSACATAIGEENPGVEVCNFADAFSTAGAATIIASLWPVTDISSTELMTHFYRGFFKEGLAKVDALRQAQLALLADPQFRHPLAWAPFILIGDWR